MFRPLLAPEARKLSNDAVVVDRRARPAPFIRASAPATALSIALSTRGIIQVINRAASCELLPEPGMLFAVVAAFTSDSRAPCHSLKIARAILHRFWVAGSGTTWPTFSVLEPGRSSRDQWRPAAEDPALPIKPPLRTIVNVSVHNGRRGIEPTVQPLQHRGFGPGQQASTLPCLDDFDHSSCAAFENFVSAFITCRNIPASLIRTPRFADQIFGLAHLP